MTDADVVKALGGTHPSPDQSCGSWLCSPGLNMDYQDVSEKIALGSHLSCYSFFLFVNNLFKLIYFIIFEFKFRFHFLDLIL